MAGEILCKHWLGPSKYSRILKKKKSKPLRGFFEIKISQYQSYY